MGGTTIDGSMSTLMVNNKMSPTSNAGEWLSQFTSILTNSAMSKYGFSKAFNECDNTNVLISIKTEDNDMFGISHKVSAVSFNTMRGLLTYLDSTDKGNRVTILEMMMSDCKPDQRIVVNVLCNLKKFTENNMSSPSNSFVYIDYFTKNDDAHASNCSCCL
jgi:hypothetical protein